MPSVLLSCKLYVHSFHVSYLRPCSNHYIYICQQMLMAFQLLGINHVISVCPGFETVCEQGERLIFFYGKKKNLVNEISLLLLVFFFFYFTYLVVLNSIKIKHFKSCLCDRFDDSVKQTIKIINHSCLYCPFHSNSNIYSAAYHLYVQYEGG